MQHQASQASAGRFISAARVFTGLTLVSRVSGLARDAIFGAVFGLSIVTSSFSIAFLLPSLFRRLFGEGVLSSALIPVLTDYDIPGDADRLEQRNRLVHTVVTLLALLLGALTVLVEVGLLLCWALWPGDLPTRLVLGLTAVMFPYVVLVCLVAVLSAVLNVRGRFAEGATAPIVLNLCQIAAATVAGTLLAWPDHIRIYLVAGSVLLGGLLQLLMVRNALRARGMTLRFRLDLAHPGVRKVMLLMAPMIVPLAVVQLNTLVDKLIAWTLIADGPGELLLAGWAVPRFLNAGAVFSIDLAARLYEMPLGVFSIALATAIFPALARHGSQNDPAALAYTLRRGLEIALLIAIPASVGLVMLREQIVQMLFEYGRFTSEDTPVVATAMAYYAVGLAAFSMQQLLIRAFYALKQVRTVVWLAVAMVALNLPLNVVLVFWLRHVGGLALSTTICAGIQCLCLAIMLRRRLGRMGGRRLASSAGRTVLASLALALAVWATQAAMGGSIFTPAGPKAVVALARAIGVLVPMAGGTGAFLLIARLLRIEALKAVLSRE